MKTRCQGAEEENQSDREKKLAREERPHREVPFPPLPQRLVSDIR